MREDTLKTSIDRTPGVPDSIEPLNGEGATRREVQVLGSLSFRVRRSNVKGARLDDRTSWDRDRFSEETANPRGVKDPTVRRP